jgi:hypothetical protein
MWPVPGRDHSYRAPGRSQSITGTIIETIASDHNNPFVRKSRNWTYQAPHATSSANKTRPIREFGVVFGSEIMKNVNNRSAPFSSRWTGTSIGSPSQIDLPNTRAM